MKKICIVTGSRAEYGLLQPLLRAIQNDDAFTLQIVVTGMHLSPEFGNTYQVIENEGFVISEKVEMLLSSDTDVGITKATGLGMIGFADAFARLKPDLVLVLGDRFEIFAAVTAAYLAKIPIAHLHGGEVTEGATDEALRHAISKMAYWHFASTNDHRNRVIQLGESPDRVFDVGAIGIDNIKKIALIPKKELAKELNFELDLPFVLVTYHPTTLENNTAQTQFEALLAAIAGFPELRFIFTKPNADANGRIIVKLIDDYVQNNADQSVAFVSLGQKKYLSALAHAQLVLGNSSSGLIEVPSFGIPTVNIGDRQKGRAKSASVIDCQNDTQAIEQAIRKALSSEFKTFCKTVEQVYGNGQTTEQIMQILKTKQIPQVLKKSFYDL